MLRLLRAPPLLRQTRFELAHLRGVESARGLGCGLGSGRARVMARAEVPTVSEVPTAVVSGEECAEACSCVQGVQGCVQRCAGVCAEVSRGMQRCRLLEQLRRASLRLCRRPHGLLAAPLRPAQLCTQQRP